MTTLATCIDEDTDQTTYPGSVDFERQPSSPQPAQVDPPVRTANHPLLPEIQCLCPFCGEFNIGVGKPCLHCGTDDTITTRMDATHRDGQWHVRHADLAITLDSEVPGMSFEDLRSLIRQHIVTTRSIVRGPSTGQLYRLAVTVRGLGREFGQCYSCGGEIENNATVCPHCDRVQTLQEFTSPKSHTPIIENQIDETPAHPSVNAMADNHEEPLVPETSGKVRDALLGEPTIRVHSLSHPDEIGEDDEKKFCVRPVIAERTERHVPKDDLLTPTELAKAFQLEFGMSENGDRPYRVSGRIERQVKVVLAGTSAMAIAFLMGMQAIRIINGPTPQPRPQIAAVTPPTKPVAVAPVKPAAPIVTTESRLASNVTLARPLPVEKPTEPYELPDPSPEATPVKPVAAAPITIAVATAPLKPAAVVSAPVVSPPKVIAIAPTVVVASTPKLEPKTIAKTQVSQVMLVQSNNADMGEDDPAALLKTGLTAEANGNYAAAVRAYERIQSLPGSMWPPQLQTRLQLARKELKGDLH